MLMHHNQKAMMSTHIKGASKARQVMSKAAQRENIKKQVIKAQETTQRYHGLFYKQDGYANIRNDAAWQKRIIRREQGIFKSWETKISFH